MDNSFRRTRQYGDSAAFVPDLLLPQAGEKQGGSGSNYQASSDVNMLPAARVTEPQRYGETVLINSTTVLAAANGGIVLQQPATVRVLLVIQNISTTVDMWINFGQPAGVNSGLRILPGGTAFYDAFVPQDQVFVFAATAVDYALQYANKAMV